VRIQVEKSNLKEILKGKGMKRRYFPFFGKILGIRTDNKYFPFFGKISIPWKLPSRKLKDLSRF